MGTRNPKPVKLDNKALMENLLLSIKNLGYHITDVKLGNTYFIMEDEDNSICHFKIKEIPGFLFGIWNVCRFDTIKYQLEKSGIGHTWADSLQISPLSELVFFTQYERELDKFKPSRSGFVTGLYRQSWYESEGDDKMIHKEEWNLYELEDILAFMKKHPYQAYVYAGRESRYIWQSISGLGAFKEYILDTLYYNKNKIIDSIKLKWNIFTCKRLIKSLKTIDMMLIDRGENWSPRLQINYRRKKTIDLETYEQDLYKIDLFENYKWKHISIDAFELYIDKESTKEDLEKDKEYKKRFDNIIKTIADEEEYKVIYSNIKELKK